MLPLLSALVTVLSFQACWANDQGVSWFVHLTDIHISQYQDLNRGPDLKHLADNVLRRVHPAVVLVTGDLTDSKTSFGRAAQNPGEWRMYKDVMEYVGNSTGLSWGDVLDIRGNHDTFDVPLRSGEIDYYSKFSASGEAFSRTRIRFSPLLQKMDGTKSKNGTKCPAGLLLGLDLAPEPGLKGPSNFLGIVDDGLVDEVDMELSNVGKEMKMMGCSPVIMAYGHYPFGNVAYADEFKWIPGVVSQRGKRLEDVLLKHGVAAYFCGHLHEKFGNQLHRIWGSEKAHLGELESADWKVTRRFRIVAVDNGALSFVDLLYKPDSSPTKFLIVPEDNTMVIGHHIVAITHPVSAFYSPLGYEQEMEASRVIRAIVFQVRPVHRSDYTVAVEWFCGGPDGIHYQGEKRMNLLDAQHPIYEATWGEGMQCEESNLLLQVVVKHQNKRDSASGLQVVHRRDAKEPLPYPHTFVEWFILKTKWVELSRKVFMYLWLTHVFGILILPKMLENRGWFSSYLHNDTCKHEIKGYGLRAVLSPLQRLCWLSQVKTFWKGQLFFCMYLWFGPWVLVRAMDGSPHCLLFRYGLFCPGSPHMDYAFVSGAHTLMVTCFHYYSTIVPATVWMIWVISSWQTPGYSSKFIRRCISLSQIGIGMAITLWHISYLKMLWVWYGATAVFLSPVIGWFGPISLVWLVSAKKELRKQRTE